MILVTGGAGFIGSNLQAALYAGGREVAVCDWLGESGKWRNLRNHPPLVVVNPDELQDFLDSHPPLETIVHLGAISETTAVDGDLVWERNVDLSQRLWRWCVSRSVRFIYASSASTYGDSSAGFSDEFSTAALRRFKPLNLYGWSKHAFDLWVAHQVESKSQTPPSWAGVKFFNVYGPNEYHKGSMVSVVKVKHDEVAAGGPARLFRSTVLGLKDGGQARDFIYVDDVVAALTFLIDSPVLHDMYNLGTGVARSYADLAAAVCAANEVPVAIEYIDMPEHLQAQYQSFTRAPVDKLRKAGFDLPFTTLEEGVRRYIQDYLTQPDPYK
jgi:ADP-L-glycero-D-manno-heptose 6-epimerase